VSGHRPGTGGVGPEKYDATATSMVGLLKYGAGLPFNRIEKLQSSMGIPLPAATQWDLVQAAAKTLTPAHEELINQAAQATVLYNDDTTMKVLQLTRKQRAAAWPTMRTASAPASSPPASSQRTPGTGSPCSSPGCVTPARISPRCSPPQHRSTRADPNVRWALAQCPERVRHDPVAVPRSCPKTLCGTDRDVPGRGALRAREPA